MDLAQLMYRNEVRLRTSLLGDSPKHIRPLSEVKYVNIPLPTRRSKYPTHNYQYTADTCPL